MFDSIENAINDIKEGKMVIVVDDRDNDNCGDVVVAAEFCSADTINFMITNARGIVRVPISAEHGSKFGLEPIMDCDSNRQCAAFTVSVDAVTTTDSVSAKDRAFTARKLADINSTPSDFCKPGHMFPIIAKRGGVLKRAGHCEAAVDLAKIAGLSPASVICEIMNEDGTIAKLPELLLFAERHSIRIVTVEDLIHHRMMGEKLVRREATINLPTQWGTFVCHAFTAPWSDNPDALHLALVKGDISNDDEPVLVRVHSECFTGDVLGSLRCDCGPQLHEAMTLIEKNGRGAVLYMRQEGRGIGLLAKLKAYKLQEEGLDTVEANVALGFDPDLRDYGIGAQILVDLGIKKLRLLTNNPVKITGLAGYGLEVVERVPVEITANKYNKRYLNTKVEKMGHYLKIK